MYATRSTGKSIGPMLGGCAGSRVARQCKALIGGDESPAGLFLLPQSPPPLHLSRSEYGTVILPVVIFAANGERSLNCFVSAKWYPQSLVNFEEN